MINIFLFLVSLNPIFNITRRYGPLREPTSSSCKGLWTLVTLQGILKNKEKIQKTSKKNSKNLDIQKIQTI